MSWLNVPFPPRLAFGIECDPEWEVNVTTTVAGWESRNLNWTNARHTYDAAFVVRTLTDHKLIREHFHMARGRFHSWPLLDPSDHECSVAQGFVVTREADSLFQLIKRYGSGQFAYDRKITRPIDVAIYENGVLQTEGADYTLDEDTGRLNFPGSNVDPDTITWSGQFYVPCRYDIGKLPVRIVNRGNDEFLVSSESISIIEVRE
jgi:uncharacterized protein (TIGR02217 family)